MKKRNFGFTLIELLVVIVIIGILATISTATFKSYFGKARDAERQSAIQNIALMIKVDGADDWKETKYIYSITELEDLMSDNDFRLPNGKNNICYFIGMASDSAGSVGDINEFVVATWGESTSTAATGTEGVLVDGTQAAVEGLSAAVLGSFACDIADDMDAVQTLFEASADFDGDIDTYDYLFIDKDGAVVDTI